MGNRSKQGRRHVARRAAKEHARKRRAKGQRQHLERIKSPAELRRIVLGARHLR
jgi:hypothetical protein